MPSDMRIQYHGLEDFIETETERTCKVDLSPLFSISQTAYKPIQWIVMCSNNDSALLDSWIITDKQVKSVVLRY